MLENSCAKLLQSCEKITLPIMGYAQVWRVWNRTASKALVLLHGGSGSWTHWQRNVLALSQTHAVWALDMPGMGDSELPVGALDANDIAPYVAQGMAQVVAQPQMALMGFSFGGLTAGYVASMAPDIVSSLYLVGIPGLGLYNHALPMRGFHESMDEAERRAVHRHNLMAIMFAHESSIDACTLNMQSLNVARDRLKRRRIARTDIMLTLQKSWTCPVHAVWGDQDALYTGRQHLIAERMQNCNLQSLTFAPDCGHWVAYERAEWFNQWASKRLNPN